MSIEKFVFLKCPYCNLSQNYPLVSHDFGADKAIYTCEKDNETGRSGCGKDFVLKYEIKLETKIFKIEGR